MKASTAVGLVLASSMSIFGLHACNSNSALASVEPVWVNGVMGVYNPDTHLFVPSTSPLFDQTCDLIQQRRGGNSWWTGSHYHWFYSPTSHLFSHPSGGFSSFHSSSSSSTHFGSARGGIGSTGHAHGGSHS